MIFTVEKNSDGSWGLYPNSGPFCGRMVASAESVDMTSVIVTAGKAVGHIKAVWGVAITHDLDVFSDTETLRAMGLGKAFKGVVEHPVSWRHDGFYDVDTKRLLKRCSRLVIFGSAIYRRG